MHHPNVLSREKTKEMIFLIGSVFVEEKKIMQKRSSSIKMGHRDPYKN